MTGEDLIAYHVESNKHDACAMAVYRKNMNVGHIPVELSSTLTASLLHIKQGF